MGILNDYPNAAAVNDALNKGVEANSAVGELKSDLDDLEIDNYFGRTIKQDSSSDGWKLLSNGLCTQDSRYKLVKFPVNNKCLYSVSGCEAFQFQNSSSVPSTGENKRVGDTFFGGGSKFAPNGATYLILSVIANETPVVKLYSKNDVFPYWNVEKNGIYISDDKKKIHVNKNGFTIRYEHSIYYIAPVDMVSEYEFTNYDESVGYARDACILAIDKTMLTNENGRNNPNDVLKIVPFTDAAKNFDANRYVPVAIWYKSYWEFYGDFAYFNNKYTAFEVDSKIIDLKKSFHTNPNIEMFSLCSHRGDVSKRNNTIEAFESAFQLGYKFIECDLRFTSDSECVVFHDNTIGGKNISDYTYSELIGAYSYIPSLTQVLLWAKKHQVAVELDCAGRVNETQIKYVYEKCERYNMLNSVVFVGYESELMYLVNNNMTNTSVYVSFLNGTPTTELIDSISNNIKKFNLFGVSINKLYLTDNIVSYAHKNGFYAQTWTVTSQSEAQTLYQTGVDLILCDASEAWNI